MLMRLGGTRVPIPNTRVKTKAADGTILETIWESRWMPDTFYLENEVNLVKEMFDEAKLN